MVIAGPGSGKTRMLIHRIAYLVRERGVPAAACPAVTFTRKATSELRARLALLLGGDARGVASASRSSGRMPTGSASRRRSASPARRSAGRPSPLRSGSPTAVPAGSSRQSRS
jgi:hypothetical protein